MIAPEPTSRPRASDSPAGDRAGNPADHPADHRLTDPELVLRAERGDRNGFEQLVRRHGDLCWAVALRALGGDDRAADPRVEAVVEQTWRAAWRGLRRRDRRLPVRVWLLSELLRAAARADQTSGSSRSQGLPRPDVTPPHRALSDSLVLLPWPQRLAWILVELHGLDDDEVAGVLDVPPREVAGLVGAAHHTLALELALAGRPAPSPASGAAGPGWAAAPDRP